MNRKIQYENIEARTTCAFVLTTRVIDNVDDRRRRRRQRRKCLKTTKLSENEHNIFCTSEGVVFVLLFFFGVFQRNIRHGLGNNENNVKKLLKSHHSLPQILTILPAQKKPATITIFQLANEQMPTSSLCCMNALHTLANSCDAYEFPCTCFGFVCV